MNYAQRTCVTCLLLLLSLPGWCAPTLQHDTVIVDGHSIAVWSRVPSHPLRTILLVHGRTWSALPDFDLQVPGKQRSVMQALAAAGYATYAIDLRGYGATPRNSDGWSTPNQAANDVSQVLQWIAKRHVKLQRPILLGWSMGSIVSHLTAQLHANDLSALILYGYPRDPSAANNATAPLQPLREINTPERAASDFISPNVISKDVIDLYVAAALKADPVRADWHQLEEYAVLSPAEIHIPTLVIHGERDPLARMPAQSRLFVALGTADKQWVVLPGADHAAMLEDTFDAFIAAIRAFAERPLATARK